MANPTSGFQLSALPQPLSMPSNLGKFDVGETQQAYANALKNTQQTALLGPQTQAAVANAAYQKGLAEQQSRLLAPEEQALIQKYRKDKILAQTEANVGEAVAPGKPGLALAKQGVETQGTALAVERLNQAAKNLGGIIPIDVGGGVKLPGIVSSEGALTLGGGGGALTSAMKMPTSEPYAVPVGGIRTDGGKSFQDYQFYVDTRFGPKPISPAKTTQLADLPPPAFGGQSGGGNQFTPAATPTAQVPAATGAAAPSPQAIAQPDNMVTPAWLGKPVPMDDPNAKAFNEIEKRKGKYNNIEFTPAQQAERSKLMEKTADVISNFSTQSMALDNAARAAANLKKDDLNGPINRILPADFLAVFGLDGRQDFDSAMLSLVEKSTGGLKNVRAYAGVQALLIDAKPKASDTPEVIQTKLKYMADIMRHTIDQASAVEYGLSSGLPAIEAESVATRNYARRPNQGGNATVETSKETPSTATNAPVQLPDTFTEEEFKKLVPIGANYVQNGKVFKRKK
jgi:hypothetical protein